MVLNIYFKWFTRFTVPLFPTFLSHMYNVHSHDQGDLTGHDEVPNHSVGFKVSFYVMPASYNYIERTCQSLIFNCLFGLYWNYITYRPCNLHNNFHEWKFFVTAQNTLSAVSCGRRHKLSYRRVKLWQLRTNFTNRSTDYDTVRQNSSSCCIYLSALRV